MAGVDIHMNLRGHTLNAYRDAGNDLVIDSLPASMPYSTRDSSGNDIVMDMRDDIIGEIYDVYGDRTLSYCCANVWKKVFKTFFSRSAVSRLGKMMGIYSLNREIDVDYSNYEHDIETELLPDTPLDGDRYLSSRVHEVMRHPSGPLGSATLIRDSMLAVDNPIYDFVAGLESMFVPLYLTDVYRCGCD